MYPLKHKSDVFATFKQKVMIEKQTGKKVKRLRTDNGMEFCSMEFDQFCKNEGIVRHCTVRYTPQQNGVAEKMNRTLLERARWMLSIAGLSQCFWAEAVNTTCYLVNQSPSQLLILRLLKRYGLVPLLTTLTYEHFVALLIFMYMMLSLNLGQRKLYFLVMLLGWKLSLIHIWRCRRRG